MRLETDNLNIHIDKALAPLNGLVKQGEVIQDNQQRDRWDRPRGRSWEYNYWEKCTIELKLSRNEGLKNIFNITKPFLKAIPVIIMLASFLVIGVKGLLFLVGLKAHLGIAKAVHTFAITALINFYSLKDYFYNRLLNESFLYSEEMKMVKHIKETADRGKGELVELTKLAKRFSELGKDREGLAKEINNKVSSVRAIIQKVKSDVRRMHEVSIDWDNRRLLSALSYEEDLMTNTARVVNGIKKRSYDLPINKSSPVTYESNNSLDSEDVKIIAMGLFIIGFSYINYRNIMS